MRATCAYCGYTNAILKKHLWEVHKKTIKDNWAVKLTKGKYQSEEELRKYILSFKVQQ